LCAGAYLAASQNNPLADIQDALIKSIMAEPIEKFMRDNAVKGVFTGFNSTEKAQTALDNKLITIEQFDILMQADAARSKVIAVDDFAPHELSRQTGTEADRNYYAKEPE
jgi:acyl-CoA dehydrogenase